MNFLYKSGQRRREQQGYVLCVVTSAEVVQQKVESQLIYTPEWRSVSSCQHNAIFQGPEQATEGLLSLLRPYLRTPAVWKRAPAPLELRTHGCGSLVLRNVGALGPPEQSALLRWLDGGQRQVVSTTVRPLFPLVARGLFDAGLYYRLNTTLISLDSTGACAE
jgi:hypothetical protein